MQAVSGLLTEPEWKEAEDSRFGWMKPAGRLSRVRLTTGLRLFQIQSSWAEQSNEGFASQISEHLSGVIMEVQLPKHTAQQKENERYLRRFHGLDGDQFPGLVRPSEDSRSVSRCSFVALTRWTVLPLALF